jgi:hypothetical protein
VTAFDLERARRAASRSAAGREQAALSAEWARWRRVERGGVPALDEDADALDGLDGLDALDALDVHGAGAGATLRPRAGSRAGSRPGGGSSRERKGALLRRNAAKDGVPPRKGDLAWRRLVATPPSRAASSRRLEGWSAGAGGGAQALTL